MKNQFFYTLVSSDEKAPIVRGSFAVNKVIRTVEYEPGQIICLLDDFHQETRQVPTQVGKNGKTAMVKSVETIASEIFLNTEDSARFIALMNIETPVEAAS